MSTAVAPSKGQKSKKEKGKEKESTSSLPQLNERLKTVVRRLPPNLPEEVFWRSVQPWVTEETAVWKIFYQGKLRKKLNKENISSRAYVAFKNEEQLASFSRGYDGHIFRDKTGVEYQAVVEFAPYSKVPSEKRKPDTRNGTIEKDEDYISFLESLKASETAEPVSLESLMALAQPPPPPKTTPLLEALKAEKAANKDKEAILRNHAHYNQINLGSSRKDEKKKVIPNSLPAKPSETPFAATSNLTSGGGKKGPKKPPPPPTNPLPPAGGSKGTGSVAAPKNAPANQPPANQAAKPSKAPRPPRSPQAKATANDATARVNLPTPALSPTPVDGPTAPAPPVAPRRTRPMIGLASRQFEAALSGVSGLAGAASERKRREKEKEKEKEKEGQAATAGPPSASPVASSSPVASFARIDAPETEKPPPPPPSPKKEKSRRGGGRGGGATAGAPQVKIPSILQRTEGPPPAVVQNGTSGPSNGSANGTAAPLNPTAKQPVVSNASGNAPRGGGRRGRGGGGRGRAGVPATAPRGG